MLELLPDEYLDNFTKWSIITNILKNYEKYDIWDEWSKQSDKYNSRKNVVIWRNTKILYLIFSF